MMADAAPLTAAGAERMVQPTADAAMAEFALRHGLRQVENMEDVELTKAPKTECITMEHLKAEVRGIYRGLKMVEDKCIEVDGKGVASESTYTKEQLTALNELHLTLVHEHFDFILASQHPQGSVALKGLVEKYKIPARLWLHGLQSHLEVMRRRLPGTFEHMATFLHNVYPLIADLWVYASRSGGKEEATWAECLGDLSRYRMAIEEGDSHLRESWRETSHSWYEKVVDTEPRTGRLYHHLAILARPYAVRQLFYYAKSQCVPVPCTGTAESILTLIDPILAGENIKITDLDRAFMRSLGILYYQSCVEKEKREFWFEPGPEPMTAECRYEQEKARFLGLLEHGGKSGRWWHEFGSNVALILCCSIVQYGTTEPNGQRDAYAIMNSLVPEAASAAKPNEKAAKVALNEGASKTPVEEASKTDAIIASRQPRVPNKTSTDGSKPGNATKHPPPSFDAAKKALDLINEVDKVVLRSQDDSNIEPEFLPYFHVRLVFLLAACGKDDTMHSHQKSLSWGLVASGLNGLLAMQKAKLASLCPGTKMEAEGFFQAAASPDLPRLRGRPLPEDWLLRGLVWLPQEYFPEQWFVVPNDDLEDRAFEDKNSHEDRVARILWLACRIVTALNGRCLRYDAVTKRFAEVEPAVKKQVSVPRAASTVVAFLRARALRWLTAPAMARLLDKITGIAKTQVALENEKALIKKEMVRSYGRINYEKKEDALIQRRKWNQAPMLLISIRITTAIFIIALLALGYFS